MSLPGGGLPEFAGICAGAVAGGGTWLALNVHRVRLASSKPVRVGAIAVVGGVVVGLASGWVAMGVVSVIALAICLPGVSAARLAARRPALLEGLAAWVDSIRSELSASKNWRNALERATVPSVLRPLSPRPVRLEDALAIVESVGGTEAELLGAALRLASTAAVGHAGEMLASVSGSLRHHAAAQREVAATRRTSQVAAVAAAAVAFLGLIFAARAVLPVVSSHAYADAHGQVILGLLCLPMLVGLVILARSTAAL